MKIYIVQNIKTKEILKVSEKNKNGLALLFNTALANWETKGSKEWQKYCEKYKTMEEYDMHLDRLEELERKEFFSNLVENNNKYNVLYQIVKVKESEKERA
jgi:hypothetical protein